MTTKICEKCSQLFSCGAEAGASCWCQSLPIVVKNIPSGFSDCLCPNCLNEFAKLQMTEPDFYFENGLMVFTEAYHLRRGSCCNSGCRHCPYKK